MRQRVSIHDRRLLRGARAAGGFGPVEHGLVSAADDEARVIAAKQDIASLMQALKLYRLDNQRYPTTEQGLQALL
ncbi:MAG: type II secretion system protein GspG, partial [Chloroflexota bacterium]